MQSYLARYCEDIGKITDQNKSVEAILFSDAPQLAELKKEVGETTLRAAIVLLIDDVLSFFNLGKTMNDLQVAQTVDLLIYEFPFFKLDDISLLLRRAKTGRYGKMYDRIDGQIIMNWAYDYDAEKTEEIIQIRQRVSSKHKSNITEAIKIDLETQNLIKDFLSKPYKIEQSTTSKPFTKTDQLVHRWIRQFDNFIEKRRDWAIDKSKRFLQIPGKETMGINEYLAYKLENYERNKIVTKK